VRGRIQETRVTDDGRGGVKHRGKRETKGNINARVQSSLLSLLNTGKEKSKHYTEYSCAFLDFLSEECKQQQNKHFNINNWINFDFVPSIIGVNTEYTSCSHEVQTDPGRPNGARSPGRGLVFGPCWFPRQSVGLAGWSEVVVDDDN